MKNLKFNLRNLSLAIALGLAVAFTSCSKEEAVAPSNTNPDTEMFKKGNGAPAPGEFSIAEIAINGGFDSLVVALSYVDAQLNAGLVDLFLNGKDQYTVFAPTNEAFAALLGNDPAAQISDLPADLVLDVLLYHVTEGRRTANSVVPKKGSRQITTLLGETFNVSPELEITAVGNMANIDPDNFNISASNGIIHVIDAVILPVVL
ncbi:MAG: fasciclin domain-containing protein [Bacteroidetes bacterium]|nr:fasciclin domain-containing protein [Bacteroidota bacterium]